MRNHLLGIDQDDRPDIIIRELTRDEALTIMRNLRSYAWVCEIGDGGRLSFVDDNQHGVDDGFPGGGDEERFTVPTELLDS
jgi:hypothetical protein